MSPDESGVPPPRARFHRMRARPFVPFFVTWYCHDVPKGLLAGMGRGWEGRDVLEAGCGGGSLLFALADEARRVHGVDISQDAIGFLRSRYVGAYDNLSVQACDFADFEATEPFDLVLSNDCFEHVDNGPGFVGAAARSLRPDGALLLQFPNHLDHGINHFSTLVDLDELRGAALRRSALLHGPPKRVARGPARGVLGSPGPGRAPTRPEPTSRPGRPEDPRTGRLFREARASPGCDRRRGVASSSRRPGR